MLSYADEISYWWRAGGLIHPLPEGRPQLFRVGVVDVVPKSSARIIGPGLQMPDPVRMMCHEASLGALLAELTVHRLEPVLADISVERRVLGPVVPIVPETTRGSLFADEYAWNE